VESRGGHVKRRARHPVAKWTQVIDRGGPKRQPEREKRENGSEDEQNSGEIRQIWLIWCHIKSVKMRVYLRQEWWYHEGD
jgi:hypothetical protein